MRAGMLGSAPERLTLGDYLQKRWLPFKETQLGQSMEWKPAQKDG